MRMRNLVVCLGITCGLLSEAAASATWIRPQDAGGPLIWGRSDGLVFGLRSAGGMPGPRGLIRVGIVNQATGKPELVNFIAVEPVTLGPGPRAGRMGFSELEMSQLDPGERGTRLWVSGDVRGELSSLPAGPDATIEISGAQKPPSSSRPEQLTVRIEVEPFTANGAHVFVIARMISSRPEEVEFSVHHHPDSAAVEELTLTATMGNYERLRLLWLKDRIVDARELYAGYQGNDFVERENHPLEQMLRTGDGGAIVLCTTDEENPSKLPVPGAPAWTYRSVKLSQYWRVAAQHIQANLRVRVNGRRSYWASSVPVPGGLAFENFEVRQRYVPGQVFVFGLSSAAPGEIEPKAARLPGR
jgi:hypothetical protein